ncbi:MAG: DNA mismatch repair endonuclease MutL [Endomicrobium sp.]|jgi:DNA mismatch repair protein MutL|nr:DNA mismatch repair endonuclease MutL [Endomicrobium sp.]
MQINILSQETIQKIAAGEIIEYPNDVVKELVENSVDAKSSNIIIEIENSGKKSIRVFDDGLGMTKKNLALSILKHTTSKIKHYNDILHIRSLGFRGEALASIAAISNIEIKTRERNKDYGWKLYLDINNRINIIPWSGSVGTIVEVKNLFFNIPVRKKIIENNFKERFKITKCIEEIALANPNIGFKIFNENKIINYIQITNKKLKRIKDILGKECIKSMKNVKVIDDNNNIKIDLYFTVKNIFLYTKKTQYFFVNSRHVCCPKWFLYCIDQAYKKYSNIINYKVLAFITISPSKVDINIHPTKKEVKFINDFENILYKKILETLSKNLKLYIYNDLKLHKLFTISKNHNLKKTIKNGISRNNIFFENDILPKNLSYNIIGQIFNTYIIIENKDILYIFDQHAVAERIKYEQYLISLKNNNIKKQQTLIPEIFNISSSKSLLLRKNLKIFNKLGIDIEEINLNSFKVLSYPTLLGSISIKSIITSILSNIEEDDFTEIDEKKKKIIRAACYYSIRANNKIHTSEIKILISSLLKCKFPLTCPHGRPTVYSVSRYKLNKIFNRR